MRNGRGEHNDAACVEKNKKVITLPDLEHLTASDHHR